MTEGYVDIEVREREKFEELDGVGPVTADKLVTRYDTFSHAVRTLLGSHSYYPDIGKSRTDEIRVALEAAGYTPPCDCQTVEDVKVSQTRDDCLQHCRGCGEVLIR